MLTKSCLLALTAVLCSILPARSQTPPSLPDGPGQEAVVQYCSGCHGLSRVVASGYPQAYWHTVIRMMLNFEVAIPPDQVIPVTDYLAKNFPEKPKPVANILPGPARIDIQEWQVPIPGSRPHDPLATRDGAIWYTGQMTNRLGRVDPKTGQIKEYPLKTPLTAPHGLVEDQGGHIWFTGNHISIVGQLDPKTGAVTEYKMPDPNAKDPHSLAFDQSGMLWFTLQQSNMIGRLDPSSGEIKLVTAPTARARPYGIMVNSKGVPFVALFGTNKIARIDPTTMEIREYPLPDASARPRRMAFTSDDVVWYSDYPRGYLGRLDPATGQVTEWQSPGGPKSQPYGIVAAKDVIWYSESGTKPNTVVRFDPKTQQFQTWPIPSGRLHRAQDGRHARRQPGAGHQYGERRRPRRGEVIGIERKGDNFCIFRPKPSASDRRETHAAEHSVRRHASRSNHSFSSVFHSFITLGVINEKCYALCMIKSFKSEETEKIFRGQFSRKLPQDIQRVAARKLEQLHAATMPDTLRVPPGNRLEALTHERQGQHSIRVNDQWRVCFVWRDGDAYDVEIVDYH